MITCKCCTIDVIGLLTTFWCKYW